MWVLIAGLVVALYFAWRAGSEATVILIVVIVSLSLSMFFGPAKTRQYEECGSGRFTWEC